MPELRIRIDKGSLSVFDEAINLYELEIALRTWMLVLLALAMLFRFDPDIAVLIALMADLVVWLCFRHDGRSAGSQHARPTVTAPLQPPPSSSTRGTSAISQPAQSYQGSPSNQNLPASPADLCDQSPPYNHLRPAPSLSSLQTDSQYAPDSSPSPPLHRHHGTHGQQARRRHGYPGSDAWGESSDSL